MKTRFAFAGVLVALVAVAIGASGAVAGSEVTQGDFHTFAAGLSRGYQITGHAQMVRRADGTTFVTIHVEGLGAQQTYPAHVHKEACGTDNADGHYKFAAPVEGGAGVGHNEIWPGPVTADGGGIANGNTTVGGTAGVEAASVVVHDTDGAKIACADLS